MAENVENVVVHQAEQEVQGEEEQVAVEEPSRKRFKIQSGGEENAWELPQEMLDYVIDQFETYIKEKDIKDKVLSINPVPTNMRKVRKLDMYLHELMKDSKKKSELELEAVFEKLQQRLILWVHWAVCGGLSTSSLEMKQGKRRY